MLINNVDDLNRAIEHGPYAWPGGYPTYFIAYDGEALSYEAVRQNLELVTEAVRDQSNDGGWRVVAFDINYEDPQLYCAHTNERIPSAYADE